MEEHFLKIAIVNDLLAFEEREVGYSQMRQSMSSPFIIYMSELFSSLDIEGDTLYYENDVVEPKGITLNEW